MISQNCFTFPLYLPRVCRIWRNWPEYLVNYVFRRNKRTEYRMRCGVRFIDDQGHLAGTLAVVFVRREYGKVDQFRTIVDIGANVGSFAIYAAQSNPNATVYCFEPESVNFDSLTRHVAINGLDDRVLAFQFAVASSTGERELAVSESLSNSFHMVSCGATMQPVACTTLGDIFEQQQLDTVDLLKMNCEGAEYEILEGCSNDVLDRISNVRLEYHNLPSTRRNGESLARFLSSRGFRIERFTRYFDTSGFIWAARSVRAKALLALAALFWSRQTQGLALLADAFWVG